MAEDFTDGLGFTDQFSAFLRPSPEKMGEAIKQGVLVLDANVLLTPYRFTPPARSDLLNVLRRVANRIFIPYQAAREFHRRRLDVLVESAGGIEKTSSELNVIEGKLQSLLGEFSNRYGLAPEEKVRLTKRFEAAFSAARREVDEHRAGFNLKVEDCLVMDPILEQLNEIFAGRTSKMPDKGETDRLIKEFEASAEAKKLPGFKDAKKKENAAGDYLMWNEVLRFAAGPGAGRFVVLVSNDAKEDWLQEIQGFKIGPRSELVEECIAAGAKGFYIINTPQLLRLARDYLGARVEDQTVRQADSPLRNRLWQVLKTMGGMSTSYSDVRSLMEVFDYLESEERSQYFSLLGRKQKLQEMLTGVTQRRAELGALDSEGYAPVDADREIDRLEAQTVDINDDLHRVVTELRLLHQVGEARAHRQARAGESDDASES